MAWSATRRMMEVGTVRGGGRNIFAVVLPDTPGRVRTVLDGSFYQVWIVGCADPESVARVGGPARRGRADLAHAARLADRLAGQGRTPAFPAQ